MQVKSPQPCGYRHVLGVFFIFFTTSRKGTEVRRRKHLRVTIRANPVASMKVALHVSYTTHGTPPSASFVFIFICIFFNIFLFVVAYFFIFFCLLSYINPSIHPSTPLSRLFGGGAARLKSFASMKPSFMTGRKISGVVGWTGNRGGSAAATSTSSLLSGASNGGGSSSIDSSNDACNNGEEAKGESGAGDGDGVGAEVEAGARAGGGAGEDEERETGGAPTQVRTPARGGGVVQAAAAAKSSASEKCRVS